MSEETQWLKFEAWALAREIKVDRELHAAGFEEWKRKNQEPLGNKLEKCSSDRPLNPQGEPDQSKPCWVGFDRGLTVNLRKQMRGHKLQLTEFAWDGWAWRPTGQNRWPTSAYDWVRGADYIGHLPKQGRARRS